MIKIITDSGADISPEVFAANDITFLPILVQLDGKEYLDQVDISPKEYYNLLGQTKATPSTSRIPPYEYEKVFTKVLDKYDEVICITFSSGLSATYESAVLAANTVAPDKISVIDSKCASFGQGLAVLRASQLVKEGKTREEIVNEIKDMCNRREHIFSCGSLEMLKRGGRISATQAILGTVLKVIPILQMQNGKIIPFDKVRGNKKMIQFMLDTIENRGNNLHEQVIGISHAGNLKMAETLKEAILERFTVKDILISEIGAAIGSHSGLKTIALFFQK